MSNPYCLLCMPITVGVAWCPQSSMTTEFELLSFLYNYIRVIYQIFYLFYSTFASCATTHNMGDSFQVQLWYRAVGFLMGCCSYLSIYLWICLQLNNFLPVLDFNKAICTHQMALTYIRIHLLKKSESEYLNIHCHLPHTLKVHHEPVSWLGHIIIMRVNKLEWIYT